MNDFLSKLENFLFDILGLILPGAIFLLILLSPILFLDMNKVTGTLADTSVILSALKTISGVLNSYWGNHPRSVLTIAVILAYLTGHTVKVFSIIIYDFLAAIFDDGLNKPVIKIFNRVKNRLFPPKAPPPKMLKDLFRPFRTVMENIFTFRPLDNNKKEDVLKKSCLDQLDTRLFITYPSDNHSLGKISAVITNQESLRSLGTFFLAKYNLYRSLALIFLFTILYYFYFFKVAGTYIAPALHEISSIILLSPVILWFTFHVKYKRYWRLYGEERLMSLFYFLNKKRVNES